VQAAAAGLPMPDVSLTRVPADVRRSCAWAGAVAEEPADPAGVRGCCAGPARLRLEHRCRCRTPPEQLATGPDRRGLLLAGRSQLHAGETYAQAPTGSYRDCSRRARAARLPRARRQFVRFRYRSSSGGYLTLINVGSSSRIAVVFPNPIAPDT